MAREITAGVLLKLKDQFSSQIKGAGVSVQGFAANAVGMAEKVNQAFSGVAGTLGTLGVSIGALAAVKSTIDLDHRMARLGLTANASASEVNKLKRQIFETAQMPDIKLNTDSIISGLEVVMTKVGDLEFVQDNVRNIALAIQASGESGDAMGAVFAEFAKFGYTMEEILPLMDDLIAQGDQGAFTFGEFAKNAPAVFSAYSDIGTSPEHIRKANAAMQILMAGTKSAEVAVTALNSTMADLSDPDKQKKLRMLGINVRDLATGEFRDFSEIMFDIVDMADQMGNADFFGTIFGTTSMKAIRAYVTQGERMYDNLVNLGDTTGLLQDKSQRMADTTKSNLRNLQTAFSSFADNVLSGPLQDITNLFNKLAENPEMVEAAIRNITRALGVLAAVRVGAGIVSLISGLVKLLKPGGGINISGLENAGGSAGIPVHVTNWGGATGSSMMPGGGNGGPIPATGAPVPAAGAGLAFGAAVLTAQALYTVADVAHAKLSKIDPAVPGMGNYYNLHPGAKRKAWERYEREHPGEPTYQERVNAMAATGSPNIPSQVNDLIVTPQGQFSTHPDDYIFAMKDPASLVNSNKRNEVRNSVAAFPPQAQGSPGVQPTNYAELYQQRYQVNDLIITPQGQFNTHPDDYIFAMKDPASLVNNKIRNEVRSVERIPQAIPPIVIDGEIELKSELVIDDRGYRLKQQVGKNSTPYKFAVGSARNARLIQ